MSRGTTALILCMTVFFGSPVKAESIAEFLKEFHSNPARTMQRLPSQVDSNGTTHDRGFIRSEESYWKSIIEYRDQIRLQLVPKQTIAAPPEALDNPAILIEPGTIIYRNIYEISEHGLTKAALSQLPWTDSYWPLAKGNTAYRYSDPGTPKSKDWIDFYNYALSNPPSGIISSGDRDSINRLSPAEKYDFVMGDSSFSLTQFAWRTGQKIFEKNGFVPGWMGICNGWAAAAHMMVPLPKLPIDIIAKNGAAVTFYPQDVKALHSMLWANASPSARFAGQRCNVPLPARNPNGRIIDKGCFDINPATWHIAIANQIGQNKRSLVMDATYDLEVWNHPISSYRLHYFNPQTWIESADPASAQIPFEKFRLDKFREFRTPETKNIIGVFMDVTYVVEVNPSRVPFDPTPPVKTLRYIYDLELDASGNILGGEWYSNAHPDFIWSYDPKIQARSPFDHETNPNNWKTTEPIPSNWTEIAIRASSRGTPLFSFLSHLLD